MSIQRDREYKLYFHWRYQTNFTVTSTTDLLYINHSTKGQIQYDVTNIDGAAAYIDGVYGFNNIIIVKLIWFIKKANKLLQAGIITLCYDATSHQVGASKAIHNVKSVLKSLQVRGD